jgi:hypothetical protein
MKKEKHKNDTTERTEEEGKEQSLCSQVFLKKPKMNS